MRRTGRNDMGVGKGMVRSHFRVSDASPLPKEISDVRNPTSGHFTGTPVGTEAAEERAIRVSSPAEGAGGGSNIRRVFALINKNQ